MCSGDCPCFNREMMSVTDSGVRSVNATSSMSIAGSWSLSPIHGSFEQTEIRRPRATELCPRLAFEGFIHLLVTAHLAITVLLK